MEKTRRWKFAVGNELFLWTSHEAAQHNICKGLSGRARPMAHPGRGSHVPTRKPCATLNSGVDLKNCLAETLTSAMLVGRSGRISKSASDVEVLYTQIARVDVR